MGFVDRGGGREAKGTSLRRSKKNPGAPTTKNKSAHKNYITPTTRATPTPPAACGPFITALAEACSVAQTDSAASAAAAAAAEAPVVQLVLATAQQSASPLHIDAAVALLSRKLEDDQEGIYRRAAEEGRLAGALCWCNEVEKQATLLDTCVQRNKLYRAAAASSASAAAPAEATRHVRFQDDVLAASPVAVTAGSPHSPTSVGVALYAVLGVHVNSIDRVNMRLHDQWIKELEENVKHGDVVGVLSGLNLSRDHGTHYAQERLLRECWRVAGTARLPLVLHLYAADSAALTETVNRAAELMQELLGAASKDAAASGAPSAVVLYNGLAALHASPAMQQLVRTHRPSVVDADAPSETAFYVLVSAEGLVERQAGDEDGADAAGGVTAPIESLAALLPSRGVGNSEEDTSAPTHATMDLSQLLIGTGAPWGTPQNLPDPYLRTLPNEPGNYLYVVETVFDVMPAAPKATAAVVATPQALAAHVFVNHLRLFFRECVEAAMADADEDAEDVDAVQQRRWAETQQPAAPTAVAGLADADAKRDLEALLAAAAAERARVEAERLREEAAQAQARSDELQEKRSKREKKKNVKANNRSNFTHFRNKDFAPRQTKQERQAHQRSLEGHVAGETESDEEDEERIEEETAAGAAATAAAGSSRRPQRRDAPSSDDDDSDEEGDGEEDAAAARGLAAEVEMLLREAEKKGKEGKGNAGKGKGKKGAKGQPSSSTTTTTATPPPPAAVGKGKSAKKNARKGGKQVEEEENGEEAAAAGSDSDSENAEGEAMQTHGQPSRRQRKRQQKRQQQQQPRGDDSDDG